MVRLSFLACTIFLALACSTNNPPHPASTSAVDWPAYGRDAGGSRYSPASQIDKRNVGRLQKAWVFRTGDYAVGSGATRFEATPILIDGALYVSTPFGRIVALDPDSGVERWSFDPVVDLSGDYGDFANRGVSTWLDPSRSAGQTCRRRIYVGTIDARLIAVDAADGKPCTDFGSEGTIALTSGLLNGLEYKGEYQITSPPAIIDDLVVIGSAIADNHRANAPSGVVRAYDARTGALRWSFDPVPRDPAAANRSTWSGSSADVTGAANAWAPISADAERDLLFVPTGSPSPDFYGGERIGQNLYANSVVALRGRTGEVVWHFQVVHHDIWDYDVASQPTLIDLQRNGQTVPALVQTTKMGHVFVLNRETGQPVFPVEERAVPRSDVAGEEPWPTQPFPVKPLPLGPEKLNEPWGLLPSDRQWCREKLASVRSEGIFTPVSLRGTVIMPGNIGGSNWSGVAIDPQRQILIAPSNRVATLLKLIPRSEFETYRKDHPGKEVSPMSGTPFGMVREFLLGPHRLPCNAPPWGVLTAIDLNTGDVRWEKPLGFVPLPWYLRFSRKWGSIDLGGAMTSGGGLVFIAGTFDEQLRAFDTETGDVLWKTQLPAGGNATPMTYVSPKSGRQYVVLAAGGHGGMGTHLGDYVVAWSLDGGAAPAAAADSPSLEGTWKGALVVDRHRYPMTIVFHESNGEVRGDLEIADPRNRGSLVGKRKGRFLDYSLTFTLASKSCSGTIRGRSELANGGSLLVGDLDVSGGCSGDEPEKGTMALRPSR